MPLRRHAFDAATPARSRLLIRMLLLAATLLRYLRCRFAAMSCFSPRRLLPRRYFAIAVAIFADFAAAPPLRRYALYAAFSPMLMSLRVQQSAYRAHTTDIIHYSAAMPLAELLLAAAPFSLRFAAMPLITLRLPPYYAAVIAA